MSCQGEGLDLFEVVGDDFRVRPLVLGGGFGDVVALVVVPGRQLACRLRLVAAEVAVGRVADVLQFFLEREFEYRFRYGVLASDLLVGESVAGDVEEACAVCW